MNFDRKNSGALSLDPMKLEHRENQYHQLDHSM